MNDWTARNETVTLANATNAYDAWTYDDVNFVVAFTDDTTDVDLALALGRSLFAIWAIQHRVRTEGAAGVLSTFTTRQARDETARIAASRTYTFIGDDVPADW